MRVRTPAHGLEHSVVPRAGPAVYLTAYVVGICVLQQFADLPTDAQIGAVLLSGVALVLIARRCAPGSRWRLAALLVAAFAIGGGGAAVQARARLADELAFDDEGRDVRLVGVVASLPARLERGVRFEVDVDEVRAPAIHVPARISVGWYDADADVRPGQRWELTARLRRPHGNLNPGGFDLEAWMLERGLRATGYVRTASGVPAPEKLDERVAGIDYAVERARWHLRERLEAALAQRSYGGVLIALVLGDQRAISSEDWALFNRTGISHLVSISGLHITMIAGVGAAAAAWAWRRDRRLLALANVPTVAATAAVAAALGYCLLAGWGVPAQRTFFMLSTVAALTVLRLRIGPAATLAIAAAVVGTIDPWAVTAPGFWLSFGAVAAIFYTEYGRLRAPVDGNPAVADGRADVAAFGGDEAPVVTADPDSTASGIGTTWRRDALPRLRAWTQRAFSIVDEAARIQIAVTLALLPLTVVLFQQVSLVSPLANAVAIPVVSFIVTPLAIVAAVLLIAPAPLAALATPLLAVAHLVFATLVDGLNALDRLPFAALAVAAPPPWTLAPALAGVAWLLAPPGWPVRWAGLVWMTPLLLWPPARPAPGELWVTALDVGQGMAMLIETADRVVLYDTGPRFGFGPNAATAGERIILPYLRWRGIGRLDALIVSHLDSDHSGGAAAILRGLPVERVLTSVAADHPMFAQAQARGTPVARCAAGDRYGLGALALDVRHPTADDYERRLSTNAMSCIVRIDHPAAAVILTGDLPARQEAELVARDAVLQVDLMTAPHHGSKTSSSAVFVAATAPRWVAIQAGYRSRFGHPHAEVIARYAASGAQIGRTDAGGATQWRFGSDGAVAMTALRIDARRYWYNQPQVRGEATTPVLPDSRRRRLPPREHRVDDPERTADSLADDLRVADPAMIVP